MWLHRLQGMCHVRRAKKRLKILILETQKRFMSAEIKKKYFFLRVKYGSVTHTSRMTNFINTEGVRHFSCFLFFVACQNGDLALLKSTTTVPYMNSQMP